MNRLTSLPSSFNLFPSLACTIPKKEGERMEEMQGDVLECTGFATLHVGRAVRGRKKLNQFHAVKAVG